MLTKNHSPFIRLLFTYIVFIGFLLSACGRANQLLIPTTERSSRQTLQPTNTEGVNKSSPILSSYTPEPSQESFQSTDTRTPSAAQTESAPLSPLSSGRIAFEARCSIYVASTEGKILTKINLNSFVGAEICLHTPIFSPDGHKIAFVGGLCESAGCNQSFRDIYITNSDGSQPKRLTYSPAIYKTGLAWSPDGANIMFSGSDQTDQGDLFLVSVNNGQNYTNLTQTLGSEYYGIWSPDGQKIAFLYTEYPKVDSFLLALYIMDADGKNRRPLTDIDVMFGKISWSLDGKTIAFRSVHGCGDIYGISPDGSNRTKIIDHPARTGAPSFSPDGRHIVFAGADFGCLNDEGGNGEPLYPGWKLYLINSDGTDLTPFPVQPNDDPTNPEWAKGPSLTIGKSYSVTKLGSGVNLREGPTLHMRSLSKLTAGAKITIIEGTVDAEDYYWWKVKTDNGLIGWVVEEAGWYAGNN